MAKSKHRIAFYFSLTVFLGLSGCASVSTFQTGRVLPEKKGRMVLGAGYYADSTFRNANGETIKFPLLEGGFRFGATKNIDVGARYTLPGTISVDGKYQLFANEKFALATGLGLGYLFLHVSSGSTSSSINVAVLDFHLPVYASYDISSVLGLYASPKFLYRLFLGNTTTNNAYVGGGIGARLGNTGGLFVEVAYLDSVKDGNDIFQFGVGIFFGSARSVPARINPDELPDAKEVAEQDVKANASHPKKIRKKKSK